MLFLEVEETCFLFKEVDSGHWTMVVTLVIFTDQQQRPVLQNMDPEQSCRAGPDDGLIMISPADRGELYLCPFLSVTNNLSSSSGYLEILAQETQTNAGQNNYITRNAAGGG